MSKLIVTLLAVALVTATAFVGLTKFQKKSVNTNDTVMFDAFNRWTASNNKVYASPEEKKFRFENFQNNLAKIQSVNSQNLDYTFGVNAYADLSPQEFKAKLFGFKASSQQKNVAALKQVNDDAVDWRNKSAVTPIKDQGQCGSCWAFSATGSLEGLYAIKQGQLVSFSEQQLVDCSTSYGNEGCNGGLMDQAFQYTKDKGIQRESDYPYKATDQKCKFDATKVVFKNTGFSDVAVDDNDALQAAVTQQPTSVAIEADEIMFYKSGIFSSKCGTQLDHGVLAVGFGSAPSPYWIVKNSWGNSWGEQGFIRFKRIAGKGVGICGITRAASYPTL